MGPKAFVDAFQGHGASEWHQMSTGLRPCGSVEALTHMKSCAESCFTVQTGELVEKIDAKQVQVESDAERGEAARALMKPQAGAHRRARANGPQCWLVAAPSLAMAENFEEENHTKAGQVRVAWAVVVNVQLVPPAG